MTIQSGAAVMAAVLAVLLVAPALAENPATLPPPEYYSERPVKGERVIRHNSPQSLFAACGGRHALACYEYATRTIHILAIGAWGTTAREQRCDLIHERGHYIAHMRGKRWNHEGERFCF